MYSLRKKALTPGGMSGATGRAAQHGDMDVQKAGIAPMRSAVVLEITTKHSIASAGTAQCFVTFFGHTPSLKGLNQVDAEF